MHKLSSASSPASSSRHGALSAALIVVLALIALVVIAVLGSVNVYNGLQARRTAVEQRVAELDSQYKRRFDLIPNLVETVKGAADFEQTTLQALVEARASVGKAALPPDVTDPAAMRAWTDAQASLGGALSRLLVVAENYPALRATQAFSDLQAQIEGTENRINIARTDLTAAIGHYNTRLRTFPGNVIGGFFSLKEVPQFQAEAAEREVPKVDFEERR